MTGEAINNRLFYLIGFTFVLLNGLAVAMEIDWVTILPFALAGLFLLLFRLEICLLLLCFVVPLSFHYDDIGFGLGISIPDEPMIMFIMILAMLKFIIHADYDYKVFRHPISIAIMVNMLWVFITSCTSEIPLVSFKFFLSRLWYVVVFYFLGVMLFRKFGNIARYLWLYLIPLAFVVVYTLIKHKAKNYSKDASYEVMQPFYEAHGVYAASIAFFIPYLAIMIFYPKKLGFTGIRWFIVAGLFYLFINGLIYSYTRAAWLSVIGAAGMFVPLFIRLRFKKLLLILTAGVFLFFTFQSDIYYLMSKTQDVSSNNMSVHLKSIANIKSDASNAERINRWVSAWRMFEDRPLFGFGPGTYMFTYASFQLFNYHTVISTDFGNIGNAHSEFLGPLSESGALGLISLLAILYFTLNTAFNLYYDASSYKVKLMAMAIMLGLVTYIVHGVMNNYSDGDKMAVLWWGSFAMITAMDMYHKEQKDPV
jgi:O-antigen ligase